jgi:hypothetical protein
MRVSLKFQDRAVYNIREKVKEALDGNGVEVSV